MSLSVLRCRIRIPASRHITYQSNLSIIQAMSTATKKVASLSELKENSMKEVEFGENKVLLTNIGGKISALSPKCTHYGAPLAKGVITAQGRIVCPWHGACFNATSGDIEDAPALDSLFKFQVEVKGDDIFVSADENALQSGKRKPTCTKAKAANGKKVVIVGGGAGGNAAAEALREEGFDGDITIISKESYLPIDRTKLSKGMEAEAAKIALRSEADYKGFDVNFALNETVKSIDFDNSKVISSGGEHSYDHLVLASGGTPRTLPIKGADLKNIYLLRTVEDNQKLSQITKQESVKNVVVIGSSFIGMELSGVFAKNAKVTVIGMEKVPFERVLGTEVGAAFQAIHEKEGIAFRMEASVDRIDPKDSDSSTVGAVVLKSGESIPADVVICGVGVAPETSYLKDSSRVKLEKDGSLKVDGHLKVQGLSNVYAIGDIATYPNVFNGIDSRIEHWNVASNHGRHVARELTGKGSVFSEVPYFWSAQLGKSARYCGSGIGYDDVLIQGEPKDMAFVAYYSKGDKVIAVTSVGKDPVVSHCAELIRLGKMPTLSEIKSGKNVLDVPLS